MLVDLLFIKNSCIIINRFIQYIKLMYDTNFVCAVIQSSPAIVNEEIRFEKQNCINIYLAVVQLLENYF